MIGEKAEMCRFSFPCFADTKKGEGFCVFCILYKCRQIPKTLAHWYMTKEKSRKQERIAPAFCFSLRACSGSLRAWSGKTLGTLSPNLCQGGQAPLGFPSFWGYREQNFDSFLADTPCVADRPPTHFFVKKKFIPACGADTTTLKVSGVFCYAHTLCGAGSIPHAGRSFFLYEKSVLRESDSLRGRGKEVCTDLTPPLFRP